MRSGVEAVAGGPRTEFSDAAIAEEQGISAVAAIGPTGIERRKVCQGRAGVVTAVRCRVVEQDVRGGRNNGRAGEVVPRLQDAIAAGGEQAVAAIGGVLPDQVGHAADTALARRSAEFGMGD